MFNKNYQPSSCGVDDLNVSVLTESKQRVKNEEFAEMLIVIISQVFIVLKKLSFTSKLYISMPHSLIEKN